jgi:uncharacterized protein
MVSSAGAEIEEFITRIARVLVDPPDGVQVTILESGTTVIVELTADPSDIGKVIGREGRMAQSMRVLLTAVATKLGKKAVLQIVEK